MKRGFTLIELLVVIAIIGILSSIAIINLNSARDRARASAAIQSLQQVVALAVLCQDAGGELLCFSTGSGTTVPCPSGPFGFIQEGEPICSVGGTSLGTWPILSRYNWIYAPNASSDSINHTFRYVGRDQNNPSISFACDQGGCAFQ